MPPRPQGWLLIMLPPPSAGSHTLTITKLTQAMTGSAWLQAVEVGGGGFLAPPPSPGQLSGRRMLFMGDSCELPSSHGLVTEAGQGMPG